MFQAHPALTRCLSQHREFTDIHGCIMRAQTRGDVAFRFLFTHGTQHQSNSNRSGAFSVTRDANHMQPNGLSPGSALYPCPPPIAAVTCDINLRRAIIDCESLPIQSQPPPQITTAAIKVIAEAQKNKKRAHQLRGLPLLPTARATMRSYQTSRMVQGTSQAKPQWKHLQLNQQRRRREMRLHTRTNRSCASRHPSIPLRIKRWLVGCYVWNVYCGHEHVALAAADEGEGALHLRENLRWPHVTFDVMVVPWHDGVACDVGGCKG